MQEPVVAGSDGWREPPDAVVMNTILCSAHLLRILARLMTGAEVPGIGIDIVNSI